MLLQAFEIVSYATSADGHGTLVGGPLMWVCRWAWDTGGKAPNVGMTCLAGQLTYTDGKPLMWVM